MAENMRYGMILRQEDNETMLAGSIQENFKPYQKEAGKIKEKMIAVALKPNERKRINSMKHGAWLCECDGNNFLYIVLIAETYSEHLGYACINEMRKQVTEIGNYFSMSAIDFEKAYGVQFEELARKYNDPRSLSATASVAAKVDLAKDKMEKSMRHALENQQDLNNVDAKTKNLKAMAEDFNDNADELRKVMYWRNMKLKMIVTMMGGAASFSVILPILQKFTG